ncbi:hypothetical protein PVAP13_8KG102100 [Panicum virgatum]|uniref:Uncharacterized protein n=1 Tax=Panicum virgatum TaxID=38727 RepID=A0A8T0PJG7_PANVG|nr:hypothetical protein PVAP13_8KG102100 [Panicum virgatum]
MPFEFGSLAVTYVGSNILKYPTYTQQYGDWWPVHPASCLVPACILHQVDEHTATHHIGRSMRREQTWLMPNGCSLSCWKQQIYSCYVRAH